MESNDVPLVISYDTELSNNNTQIFKKTLEKHNWNFTFIGDGTQWTGFKDRMIRYYNFLQGLSEDKIVILSDARDVFCLRDSTLFVEQIKHIIDKKIIISAECFLIGHMNWNDTEILNAKTKNPNFFFQGIPINKYWEYYNKLNELPLRKYVNAGLVAGRAKHLKNAFKWIIDNNYNDDQLGFANYSNNYPELIHVDYDANILHTSTGFVNGCLYDYENQKKDTPTFTELFGLSNYFLHIPGLNGSKGQQQIYDVITRILIDNIIDKDIFSIYKITHKSNLLQHFTTNAK